MWNWLRVLFIEHDWVELDDEHRECRVCDKAQETDTRVEILGPNPWTTVRRGNAARHFEKVEIAEPTKKHEASQAAVGLTEAESV